MRNRRAREYVGRDPRRRIGNAVLAALDTGTAQAAAAIDWRPAASRTVGRAPAGTCATRAHLDPHGTVPGRQCRRDAAGGPATEYFPRAACRVHGAGARLGGALDRQARPGRPDAVSACRLGDW